MGTRDQNGICFAIQISGVGCASSRTSIVFFCTPNWDAVIKPMPTLVTEQQPAAFEPFICGDKMPF